MSRVGDSAAAAVGPVGDNAPVPRRVAAITGTRADYGLLRPTLRALHADPRFELSVIACAMHLSPRFGETVREVEADGLPVAARVPTEVERDDPTAFGERLGGAVAGFAGVLHDLRPHVLLLLGDRYEQLAGALAASGLGVAVAHLHGGELSEGSLDDAMRHCITKLSHLHFPAARPYAERICQLGEQPGRVHVVGAAGLEAIRTLDLLDADALGAELGVGELERPLVALTVHPESLDPDASPRLAEEVAAAARELLEGGGTAIATLPNDDPGNAAVREAVVGLAAGHERVHAFDSLGQLRYLSLLGCADAMLGNSSSGLLEAPAFGLPVVNVGDRQRGRLRGRNVIDVPADRAAILDALRRAFAPGFRDGLRGAPNPYGDGRVSERVVAALAAADLAGLRRKRFLDLPDHGWRESLGLAEDAA